MGKTFSVVAERAPVRCEVCHQADEFDASSGRCERCAQLSIPEIAVHRPDTDPEYMRWKTKLRLFIGLAIALPIIHCLSRPLLWFLNSSYSNPIADRISENTATFILLCVWGMFYLSVFFEAVFLIGILGVLAEKPKKAKSRLNEAVRIPT